MGTLVMRSVLLLVHFPALISSRPNRSPYFRKDYTYLSSTGNFYKLHWEDKTWDEAKETCETEDAILFHPDDHYEAREAIEFWFKQHPYGEIYVGLNDITVEGAFETADGRPENDVYSNWEPRQPDNFERNEDCVVLHSDGIINDIVCTHKKPFICKKAVEDYEVECNYSRPEQSCCEWVQPAVCCGCVPSSCECS